MSDPFERLRLRRVINVSGTETPYGASPVCQEVIDAVAELVPHAVEMSELQSAASRVIVRATGAEAGCVTGCTAASITITVAAAMTGCDLGRVEQLPDTSGMKYKVVLQKGHEISYEHRVSQNVRLAGAQVGEIGAATECGLYQLRHALTPDTVAALYVVSHLAVQHNLIDLKSFCRMCHEAGVPVIVDAASRPDPERFINDGADVVLFSAHKAFDGLTAGVVAGRRDLIQACIYQGHGIGRTMKPGKEAVIGVIAALERAMGQDRKFHEAALDARLARVEQRLLDISGLQVGRFGPQIQLSLDRSEAGFSASDLARALRCGDPAVIVWRHLSAEGILRMTLRKVTDETADYVCDRIREILTSADRFGAEELAPNIADEVLLRLQMSP